MKIAVSSTGASLDDALDPRLGRCPTLMVVDTTDLSFQAVDNDSDSQSGGAGTRTAQRLAQLNVELVLTGRCGPNAQQVLDAAGIRVLTGCTGTVTEAIQRLARGEMPPTGAPKGPPLQEESPG